jgi:FKBP-type peptidyl-prolyl cis-trans isomerase
MHISDKWEVYIPAEMGYGKFSQPYLCQYIWKVYEL